VIVVITAALLAGGAYVRGARSNGAPPVAGVARGLEPAAGPAMLTTDEAIAFWRDRYERDPRDFISLTHLGEAFLRKGRESGDGGYASRAEAALRAALDLQPTDQRALSALSAALLAQHDFTGALELAQHVYATDPGSLQALATIGDAQIELGNYDAARAAYAELLERAPGPAVYARQAYLDWLLGRPETALDLMQRAAGEAAARDQSGATVAWYHVRMGEFVFSLGRIEEAEQHFTTAGKHFSDYYLALAGIARVRAAQGRLAEAIALYEQVITIAPQPGFLAALGDVYAVSDQPDAARRQYETLDALGQLAASNATGNRQLALIYANHNRKLAEALDLAQRELAQRPDIYSYDALAWALYKNGRYDDAADAIGPAMALGTRDAQLFYHAGMINAALGDEQHAAALLAEALSINPHFDQLQARVARATLERLRAR
jgi:tetratricopeptide (TPR) repeat protein